VRRVYSKSREEAFEVTVDWNLGNTCNFGCSYCHPHFRIGTNPFPDLRKAKLFVDRIANRHHKSHSNRVIRVSLVGGEPTAYDGLIGLCEHMRSHGFVVEIKTNGSLDLPGWKRLAPHLSNVTLTYHHGRLSQDHLEAVVRLLKEEFVAAMVSFAVTPDNFDEVFAYREAFGARHQHLFSDIQLLFQDHTTRKQLLPYSQEQMAKFQSTMATATVQTSDHFIEHDNGSIEPFHHSYDIIMKQRNSFTGMSCRIGVDQLVVDQDGTIRGGWCRVGGKLGTIQDENFEKPTEGVICTRRTCNNPLDLAVRKGREDD
jgi:organic radical activating enzyme